LLLLRSKNKKIGLITLLDETSAKLRLSIDDNKKVFVFPSDAVVVVVVVVVAGCCRKQKREWENCSAVIRRLNFYDAQKKILNRMKVETGN